MEIASLPASAAASASNADKAGKSLADNFDTFLKLLTTQLQNQDPLSPLDSNEFTQQLVQFSQVEQSIATNKNMEKAIDLLSAGRNADAVSYLGKNISAKGDSTYLTGGAAVWSYQFDAPVASTAITVTDAAGKLVYVGSGSTDTGLHDFEWNGTDNTGNALPDGEYTIAVTGKDTDGKLAAASTYVHGHVDGVNTTGEDPYVLLGSVAIPLSDVLEVREPPTETPPQA